MFVPEKFDLMTELMGVNVIPRLKKCGKGVMIYPLAKVVNPHLVEIGDHSRLVDYVFIHPGLGVTIGRYTDIQQFTSIWAGGETHIGSYVNVGPGTTFLSGKVLYQKGGFMTSVVPVEFQGFDYSTIMLDDHVYIGANCTIMLDVHIGQGAVVGANSFVNKDLEAWGVYAGSPARKIGERPRDVLELEKKFLQWESQQGQRSGAD